MDMVKKYQYTLVLFVISGAIFLSGVLPYGATLFHLYGVPGEYERVTGTVLAVEEKKTTINQEMYAISLVFSIENQETGLLEEHIATFDSPLDSVEVGMALGVLCHLPDPGYIFQEWYIWQQFCIFCGFSLMGFFTGLITMNPVTVVSKARKPRTLRERLEQY